MPYYENDPLVGILLELNSLTIGETPRLHSPTWATGVERKRLLRQQRPVHRLDVVDSARMVSFDDERWNHLTGGYKIPFDPRPCLRKLENQQDRAAAWEELWDELHCNASVCWCGFLKISRYPFSQISMLLGIC